MVAAGKLIELLFGLPYLSALFIVSGLLIAFVAFGGMLPTTWVQIIKRVSRLALHESWLTVILPAPAYPGSVC